MSPPQFLRSCITAVHTRSTVFKRLIFKLCTLYSPAAPITLPSAHPMSHQVALSGSHIGHTASTEERPIGRAKRRKGDSQGHQPGPGPQNLVPRTTEESREGSPAATWKTGSKPHQKQSLQTQGQVGIFLGDYLSSGRGCEQLM